MQEMAVFLKYFFYIEVLLLLHYFMVKLEFWKKSVHKKDKICSK